MGLIRLFLAICVMRGHLATNVTSPLHIALIDPLMRTINGGQALLMFYVISGFMISTALANKYPPGAAGTLAFYRGRCVRIFSLYWPVAALALILLPEARAGFAASNWLGRLSDIAVFGLDWRIWLYPTFTDSHLWTSTVQGMEQSWSLGAEMTFYLFAPLILRSWCASLAIGAVAVIVRVAMIRQFGAGSLTTYFFTPAALIFFMLGHFVRVAADRYKLLKRTKLAIRMLIAAAVLSALLPAWDTPIFWLMFLAFAFSLPGIFERTRTNRIMELAGDLSFGVYLTHKIILLIWSDYEIPQHIVAAAALPIHSLNGMMLLTILVMTTLAASALLHFGVERPLGLMLRAALTRDRARVPTAILKSPAE